jgi:hypothetical protein
MRGNNVKVAKGILTKASESGYDQHSALIDWRNAPSENGPSPVQIMFNRRTRTTLPTAEQLLTAPRARNANEALTKAKQKQAKYYNKGAKDRSALPVGQTVRVKLDDRSDWQKGQIGKKRPFRSYDVQLESGVVRRRTSRHARRSSKAPVIRNEGEVETDVQPTSTTIALPSEQDIAQRPSMPASTATSNGPAPASISVWMRTVKTSRIPMMTTRCGRRVSKPVRYRDD